MKITAKKKIHGALWIMECPKCESIKASASEQQYLPKFASCDCDNYNLPTKDDYEPIIRPFYISGYLKDSHVGHIDSDGKFNTNDNLPDESRMFFDSRDEALEFINDLGNENNHPDFKYVIGEVEY